MLFLVTMLGCFITNMEKLIFGRGKRFITQALNSYTFALYFQININSCIKFLKTYIPSNLEIKQAYFHLYTNQIVTC